MSTKSARQAIALDQETATALEEGLRRAELENERYTPEQVRDDARRLAKEWREKINHQASA